jgi:N-acetylmuramoyl-L-alanine amidase
MAKPLWITAGHQVLNGQGTGAHGVNGFDEAVEARKLVNDIIAHQKKWYKLDSYTDNDTDSLNAVIQKQVNAVNSDWVCLDVHFNAGPATATGTEMLIPKEYTKHEIELAAALAKAVSNTLGIPKRKGRLLTLGVKTEDESQHSRIGMLSRPFKAVNVLAEICFISNPANVAVYRKEYWNLVKAISDELGNYRTA